MKRLLKILIISIISVSQPIQVSADTREIYCSQNSCIPAPGSTYSSSIQEKATYSAFDMGFNGEDLSVKVIPNQWAKDLHLHLFNGEFDSASNITVDLSSSVKEKDAANFVLIGDNFNQLNVKLNGYSGKSGKDASQICAENFASLKYGNDAYVKFLQNRANPSNFLTSDRCGGLDVSDLNTSQFSCQDPSYSDVSSTRSIDVTRVRKVSKCLSIIPQPICVQPAYKVTCNYDLWIKNFASRQGSGENYMNMVPDSDWYNSQNSFNTQYTRDIFPYANGGNPDLNNSWKNSILAYKQRIDDGTDGVFFWDMANYLISTTNNQYHDGCSSSGFWTAYNYYTANYFDPLRPNFTSFTRSNPNIPYHMTFSQNSGSSQAVQIKNEDFYVNQSELNDINSSPDGLLNFCNARSDKLPSSLASRISEVSARRAALESGLDSSANVYFFRNNLHAYGGDGCNGRIFQTSRSRSDLTYRARSTSVPAISSPGLDSTGLRLANSTPLAPTANAPYRFTNPVGWKMEIMKGFAPSCNSEYNQISIESTNIVKYNDSIGNCIGIQSCDISNTGIGCTIDPDNLGTYNYIGLDPDPLNRTENLTCSLTGCPVENSLREENRQLDQLTPTQGENGTSQGSGLIFIYDARNITLQSSVGQAGDGGKNDLPSPVNEKICVNKRDQTTDPNSNYKNDPVVTFKRINWKTFGVDGGAIPGTVPPFNGKKIDVFKKIDPAVLYLLKKELL